MYGWLLDERLRLRSYKSLTPVRAFTKSSKSDKHFMYAMLDTERKHRTRPSGDNGIRNLRCPYRQCIPG